MRAVKVFADTNVAFYSREDTNDPKAATAQYWLRECAERRSLILNLQVLNELANVLFRKRNFMSDEHVFEAIDRLAMLGSQPVSIQTVQAARSVRATTRYSWWDCLLLASALELGCSHFLSEDLQDGHEIGGLTIINPFLHAPDEVFGPAQD
jgi:predicted nucleic acid-binding protein